MVLYDGIATIGTGSTQVLVSIAGFPDSNYSVVVSPSGNSSVQVYAAVYSDSSFIIYGAPGTYYWIATNGVTTGTTGTQGPPGPPGIGVTGPTGAGGADWSQYPATQDVIVTGYNLDVNTITGLGGLMTTLSATLIDGIQTLTLDGNIVGGVGVTGPTGADGQSSSYFDYQAQVNGGGNPTSGHITWENATQIDSTYIRVSHINNDGVDIDIFLNLVQEGNILIIQDRDVSANFQKWVVDGTPIPNTGDGFVEYPVALTASGGTTNFLSNHRIILATIIPGPQGPAGPTGATGSTEGLQYILTGTTIAGTITNLPNSTTWNQNTWTLASTISFTVPPNWSTNNFVCWDGWALYDFNINNTNYWCVYYTTTSQPVEQALLGIKPGITNAIANTQSNNSQFYFPLNVLIPPTFLVASQTINLRIYGYTTATSGAVQFSITPQINARVSVTLD
jgi:hypothetical protein